MTLIRRCGCVLYGVLLKGLCQYPVRIRVLGADKPIGFTKPHWRGCDKLFLIQAKMILKYFTSVFM